MGKSLNLEGANKSCAYSAWEYSFLMQHAVYREDSFAPSLTRERSAISCDTSH